ncbi:unnamed protein product [Closterium sp. NIES-53]
MVRHRLVSSLPEPLAPLPRLPAPPCTPCGEGWQRAAPHSSSFPPTTAPLQTLHLDVWGPSPVLGPRHECYVLIVVNDYSRYTTVFPLRRKADVPTFLEPWLLARGGARGLCGLRLHSNRGGKFSSARLETLYQGWGIIQSYMLPDSPQQNEVAERRIGLVMEVSRTSMCHASAPEFLWPQAVHYVAHQLNLWPSDARPRVTPIFLWTGFPGVAADYRVWGCLAHVRAPSANKLSVRTRACVFLSFPLDASGWVFYDQVTHQFFASQDVTFDESVSYYRSHPYRVAPSPSRLAPSGVSHVTPQSSPLQRPVPVVSGGVGGAVAEGEGTRAAGARGASSGSLLVRLRGRSLHSLGVFLLEALESLGVLSVEVLVLGGTAAAAAAAVSVEASRESRGGVTAIAAAAATAAAVSVGATGEGRGGVTAAAAAAAAAAVSVGASTIAGEGRAGVPNAAAGVVAATAGESRGGATGAAGGAGAAAAIARGDGAWNRCSPLSHAVSPEPRRSRYRADGPFHLVLCSHVPPPPVLPQPPESSLTVFHDPLSDYLRASRPVISRVLSALVTHPTAPLPSVSVLVTTIAGFASSHRLDYAAHLVSGRARSPLSRGAPVFPLEVLEDRQLELGFLAATVPHLCAMLLAPEEDPDALDIPIPRNHAEAVSEP